MGSHPLFLWPWSIVFCIVYQRVTVSTRSSPKAWAPVTIHRHRRRNQLTWPVRASLPGKDSPAQQIGIIML